MKTLAPSGKLAVEINNRRVMLSHADEVGVREAAKIHGVHPSTLWRIRNRASDGRPLCDGRRFNSGSPSTVDETRIKWALAYMAAHQRAPLSVVCRELNKVAQVQGWPITNYYALRRSIDKLPADLRRLLAEGGKAVFEKTALVARREHDRPLQLVQMDSSEMPIWTVHPATGELIKPWMTGVIDSRTRVVLGVEFHLEDPTALDAARALYRAFNPKDDPAIPFFGIPENVQTDNAQVFIGELLSGVAVRAGFTLSQIPKKAPEANGKIERFFSTFQTCFLSRLEGYASQSSAKHKAESYGVVPWEVIKACAKRFLYEYHATVHSTLGKTPWEAWHEEVGQAVNFAMPPALIRNLMKIDLGCEVNRTGVTVLGASYTGQCIAGIVGETVTVLTSPFGGDSFVDVYHHGNMIGKLVPNTGSMAPIVNKARLNRQIAISKIRRNLAESLSECPPVDAPETVIPAEERKRIKAAQAKPRRKGVIRPVSLPIESDKR